MFNPFIKLQYHGRPQQYGEADAKQRTEQVGVMINRIIFTPG